MDIQTIILQQIDIILPLWRIGGWFILGFVLGRIAHIFEVDKNKPTG